MTATDDLVNRWFIHKWTTGATHMTPYYDEKIHGDPWRIEVVTLDGEWSCDCYSSYTRDDSKELVARLMTKSGWVDVKYGSWYDFPEFVEEIIEFGALVDSCSVERRHEENGY